MKRPNKKDYRMDVFISESERYISDLDKHIDSIHSIIKKDLKQMSVMKNEIETVIKEYDNEHKTTNTEKGS